MSTGCKLLKTYKAGYCTGMGALADRTLPWKRVRFYARAFLLEHPEKGLILIDTGYGEAIFDATRRGLPRLYRKLLPISFDPSMSVKKQMLRDGISPSDLSYLVLTHFHPDHVGALHEFKDSPWVYRQEVLESLMRLSPFRALRNGFIHHLIPETPKYSIPLLEKEFQPVLPSFSAVDLFGDGSFFLVDLPGHAKGQMGVLTGNQFYVADALWSTKDRPHLFGEWVQGSVKTYRETYEKLKKLPDNIVTIPTHTIESV